MQLPCGHQVCEVEVLDETLDTGPLGNLLLGVSTCDLPWVDVDASNNGMGEGAVFGALFIAYQH